MRSQTRSSRFEGLVKSSEQMLRRLSCNSLTSLTRNDETRPVSEPGRRVRLFRHVNFQDLNDQQDALHDLCDSLLKIWPI